MSLAAIRPVSGRRRPSYLRWIALAAEARRQRATLANLPPDRLDDIGLTPDAARAEANRPVWDVPGHWLR